MASVPVDFSASACAIGAHVPGHVFTEPDWPDRPRRARIAERIRVELDAGVRRAGGSGVSVRVLDLSPAGFRMETHLELSQGTDLWLRLPGLESRHAKVAWRRGPCFGCAFVEPLHPAVVDTVVRRARPA